MITDWGGSNDHIKGVEAGSDLEMPTPGFDSARQIVAAVKDGRLAESAVDECVDRLLEAVFTLVKEEGRPEQFDEKANHEIARKAAAQSAVLLKNEDGILPLKKGARVALIGDFAFDPRYQGAGSSMVNTTMLDNMADLIGQYDLVPVGTSKGYKRTGEEDAALAKEAVDLARTADVVLYCFGLDELSANDAICQMYYAKSAIARFAYKKLTQMKKKTEDAGKPDLNILFIYNMPFRAIAKMTGGMVSSEMVDGIVTMVNGHLFRGLKKTVGGFFRNRRLNKKYLKEISGN